MKYKNVAALLAAAMMALTLLAGCARGGAENALDLTEVNAIVQKNGCKTRVTASGALKRAVNETAEWAAAYDADEVTKDRIERHMTQKLDSWNKTVGLSPRLVTAEELQAGVESASLGTVHTPEEMAAGIVLSMNDILRQVEYEAAAAQATTRDGTVCWIVVVIYYL